MWQLSVYCFLNDRALELTKQPMFRSLNKYYPILSLIFFLLSIVGGLVLVRQREILQNKANSPCTDGYVACTGSGGCSGLKYVNSQCQETACSCSSTSGGNKGGTTCNKSSCGACQIPDGATSYDRNSNTCYICRGNMSGNGTFEVGGGCGPNSTGSYQTNGSTGAIISTPVPSKTSTSSSPIPNPAAAGWQCQVCDCSTGGWVNGQCTRCGGMVPCSSVSAVSCGQIDACPPGQPSSQCGAAAENRQIGNNCSGTTQTQTSLLPTKIPATATPTKIAISTATPTPTRIPSLTSTPTLTPSPTTTPAPTSTPTPTPTTAPALTPTNIPTTTPTLTSQPTATLQPLAQGPSPTRIILPNAGVDFPLKGLTVAGAIVTLLGLLVLL